MPDGKACHDYRYPYTLILTLDLPGAVHPVAGLFCVYGSKRVQ